jgi:hypothetical protein
MTTYLVEKLITYGHDTLDYCYTLKDAKEVLQKLSDQKGLSILCIKGPAFGEGFHRYRLIKVSLKSGNFKYKRLTSSWDMKNN